MDLERAGDESSELHHVHESWATGSAGPVLVAVWRGDTTLADVQRLSEAFRALARRSDASAGFFVVLEATAAPPGPAVRDALTDFLASLSGRCAMSLLVTEGDGFASNALRGVATGMAMRAKHPQRIASSREDAVRWFVEEAPTAWRLSESSLGKAIARSRERVGTGALVER